MENKPLKFVAIPKQKCKAQELICKLTFGLMLFIISTTVGITAVVLIVVTEIVILKVLFTMFASVVCIIAAYFAYFIAKYAM